MTGNSSENSGNRTSELRITLTDARNLIPEFDGNTADLHRFLSCCELLFSQAKSEADKQMFLSILKTKLTGPAYDIFKYKEVSSWEELKGELIAQFQEHRPRVVILGELMRLKQTPRESVHDFAARITKHLADLNSATINEAADVSARNYLIAENEKNAIRTFEDGLKEDQLKVIVKARSEVSLRKLINFASEHSQRIEESRTNFSQRSPPNPITCGFCNKKGHTQESCYRRKQLPAIPTYPFVKREVNRISCSYCRKPNHSARECRKRQYDEQHRHPPPQYSQRQPINTNASRQFNNPATRDSLRIQPRQMKQVRWSTPARNEPGNEFTQEYSDGEASCELMTQAVVHHPQN